MLSDTQRQQFAEDGYFLLHEFFPPAEIDALRGRIDRFAEAHQAELAAQGTSGISRANEISFTPHLAGRDAHLWRFVAQPRLVALTTALLGPDIDLYWDQAVYKRPETRREFPWHQDNGYIPVEPQQYVTCWLALQDAHIDNGCVWVLPGTHKQGLVPHQATPIGMQCYFGEDTGVPVELTQGSLAVFSSLLFHRSGPNLSQGERKAYIMQFTPAGARHAETGVPFEKPPVARGGVAV